MLRQRGRLISVLLALSDAAATVAAFLAAYYAAGIGLEKVLPEFFGPVLKIGEYAWILLLMVPAWWVLLFFFGEYALDQIQQRRRLLAGLVRPALVVALILGAAVFVAQEKFFSRRVLSAFVLLNFLLVLLGRRALLSAAAGIARQARNRRNLLIVGSPARAQSFVEAIARDPWGLRAMGFVSDAALRAVGELACLGSLADLPRLLEEQVVDDVVVVEAEGGLAGINAVIRACEEVGVRVHVQATCFDAVLSRPHLEDFRGFRFLAFAAGPTDQLRMGLKRALDVVTSAMLLLYFSPALLGIAAAIRLTSRGPALFRQMRSGLNGRRFELLKFRSMVERADARKKEVAGLNIMSGPVFKAAADPRVTSLGRILRRYSIDELPQLWNVLKGDMSLVGPRPALPAEVEKYERWQRRRLSMRPGITGLWQVRGRNLVDFDEWMRLDLDYIDRWSPGLDLRIIFETLPAVLRGTGL